MGVPVPRRTDLSAPSSHSPSHSSPHPSPTPSPESSPASSPSVVRLLSSCSPARRAATGLVSAALLAATGVLAGAGPAGAAPSGGPGTVAGTGDVLRFTVRDSGDPAYDGTYELRCRPARGGHPAPLRACGALDRAEAEGKEPFRAVPSGAMCTMVDGGPATARVTGFWHGRAVDAEFSRHNGCEIDRWQALVPALPRVR
ncbi:hypothetical protein DEH18_00550 [Streptomyces sp. NHF165]|nr:hypothetical protein [Streptomyces cacaoi]QHF92647.1 hypothetical protein DEH18_00550 [Streptomyces sp. NHF165]